MQTESCLFCLCGAETDRLIHNVRCRCNYTYHQTCFDSYDRKQICPLCKKDVGPPPDISDISIIVATPGQVIRQSRPQPVRPTASNATPLIQTNSVTAPPLLQPRQIRLMNILAALGCAAIIITIIIFVINLAA